MWINAYINRCRFIWDIPEPSYIWLVYSIAIQCGLMQAKLTAAWLECVRMTNNAHYTVRSYHNLPCPLFELHASRIFGNWTLGSLWYRYTYTYSINACEQISSSSHGLTVIVTVTEADGQITTKNHALSHINLLFDWRSAHMISIRHSVHTKINMT